MIRCRGTLVANYKHAHRFIICCMPRSKRRIYISSQGATLPPKANVLNIHRKKDVPVVKDSVS